MKWPSGSAGCCTHSLLPVLQVEPAQMARYGVHDHSMRNSHITCQVSCQNIHVSINRSAGTMPLQEHPLHFAGIFFGRSIMQCYWFGVDRTRWARTTHALRMGREYTEPFEGFGTSDKHEISSLCWFMCCLGELTLQAERILCAV